jgi:phosphoribosylformylglycinamidine (FGAM) synthase PurS component
MTTHDETQHADDTPRRESAADAGGVSMADTSQGEEIEAGASGAKPPMSRASSVASLGDASPGSGTAAAAAAAVVAASVAPEPSRGGVAFLAEVVVMPRGEVADPQGMTIEKALRRSAEDAGQPLKIAKMRVGKVFRFRIVAASQADAEARVAELADRVLANPNVEAFTCTVVGA